MDVSNATRLAKLQARLILVETAIEATYTRGVASYSDEIQSLVSLGAAELERRESAIENEIKRLERGSRLGGVGFKAVSG